MTASNQRCRSVDASHAQRARWPPFTTDPRPYVRLSEPHWPCRRTM